MQRLLSKVPCSPEFPLCWAGTDPVQLELSPGEGVHALSRSSSLSGQKPPTHRPWRSGSAPVWQCILLPPQGHRHTPPASGARTHTHAPPRTRRLSSPFACPSHARPFFAHRFKSCVPATCQAVLTSALADLAAEPELSELSPLSER